MLFRGCKQLFPTGYTCSFNCYLDVIQCLTDLYHQEILQIEPINSKRGGTRVIIPEYVKNLPWRNPSLLAMEDEVTCAQTMEVLMVIISPMDVDQSSTPPNQFIKIPTDSTTPCSESGKRRAKDDPHMY